MTWQTPFLSVLNGTDKDALQAIFGSLTKELERLSREIDDLKIQMTDRNRKK